MARTIGIGIQDFSKLREGNYFYIDKTSFIKEWWEGGDDVTLIARPRRFGKTLNMTMLEQFFSRDYAGRSDLFEGLSIWEDKKYQDLQGTFPVISLSFASIKDTNYTTVRKKICQLLTDLYARNSYLLESDKLYETDKDYFKRVNEKMDDADATIALNRLSDFLYRYYDKKVVILLDEYDTPMQEAYVSGFWNEMTDFIRSLFNATFKTNPYMERAIMTGITRVSKESVFSDLNNLKVVTTTSNEYATSFGFMEEEVFVALDECGLGEEKEEVKRWYDGFVFGEYKDIYNPWSILNFLDTGRYTTFWANTSSNRLVSKLVQEGNRNIKQSMEQLLKGEHVHCPIDEQIVYNQLEDDEEAIWSLLVASGYLKIVDYENEKLLKYGDDPLYELAITNYEVKRMFFSMIRGWFKKTKAEYNYFVEAMFSEDIETMNEYMNEITCEIFSSFDTGKRA